MRLMEKQKNRLTAVQTKDSVNGAVKSCVQFCFLRFNHHPQLPLYCHWCPRRSLQNTTNERPCYPVVEFKISCKIFDMAY